MRRRREDYVFLGLRNAQHPVQSANGPRTGIRARRAVPDGRLQRAGGCAIPYTLKLWTHDLCFKPTIGPLFLGPEVPERFPAIR